MTGVFLVHLSLEFIHLLAGLIRLFFVFLF